MAVGLEIYNSSGTKVWDNTKTTLFYAYTGNVPTNTTTNYNIASWPTAPRLHLPLILFDNYTTVNQTVNLHGYISVNYSFDGANLSIYPQTFFSNFSGWPYTSVPATMRLDVFLL